VGDAKESVDEVDEAEGSKVDCQDALKDRWICTSEMVMVWNSLLSAVRNG